MDEHVDNVHTTVKVLSIPLNQQNESSMRATNYTQAFATLQSFVLQSWKSKFSSFPQNGSGRKTLKTKDWQGFSLFVLCSVENCNVAITLYSFLNYGKANVRYFFLYGSSCRTSRNISFSFLFPLIQPYSSDRRNATFVLFLSKANVRKKFIVFQSHKRNVRLYSHK